MRQLYFLEIESLHGSGALDEMFLSLPDARKTRLSGYRHEIDRITGACSEILIRCLICLNAGTKNEDIDIRTTATGKPYLASGPRYEFNTSHTRNAVAAALSDEPVGVDIERIRNVDTAVAKRVFSRNELDLLDASAEDRHIRFLELWTKKEALLKCRGTGLSNSMTAIDTVGDLSGEAITTMRTGGYIISVCSTEKFRENDLIKISETDLFGLWRDYAR